MSYFEVKVTKPFTLVGIGVNPLPLWALPYISFKSKKQDFENYPVLKLSRQADRCLTAIIVSPINHSF